MSTTQKLVPRLLWFVGLWLGGVATVTLVGIIIKLMLGH
jgi:hypothetical protein